MKIDEPKTAFEHKKDALVQDPEYLKETEQDILI